MIYAKLYKSKTRSVFLSHRIPTTGHKIPLPIKNHEEIIMHEIFFVLEIIGTVAFAIAGAMAAIYKHLDIFGVLVC